MVFQLDNVQPIVEKGIANAKAHDINVHTLMWQDLFCSQTFMLKDLFWKAT